MVFTNKYTETILKKITGFRQSKSLEDAINLYKDGDSVNIYTIFTGLTNYIVNELVKKYQTTSEEEVSIYQLVESIRIKYCDFAEGTDEFDLDNAACTCFLEDLINKASWGDIDYGRFVPYLGVKSKEFCKAWDEFTGVKTPGL